MRKAIFITAFLCLMVNVASATVQYTVTDLGTLGGNMSDAAGINESGQVAGTSRGADGDMHAFLYDDGIMTDIGTSGVVSSGYGGINDSGQIAGISNWHAVFYDGGIMTDIGTLKEYSGYSSAYGINNNGQIVGTSFSGSAHHGSAYHAFLYDGGTMTDLGTLGGTNAGASSINNSGQIAGGSHLTEDSGYHAFLYDNGTMIDLGTFGGVRSYAYGINNNGQVVGYSITADEDSHAFLYDNDAMIDLGTLGGTSSQACGINDSEQVVGSSYFALNDTKSHAFLYDETLGMLDLNNLILPNSGWELQIARDINSSGQIVGYGQINGKKHAFLLTPDPAIPVADAGKYLVVHADGQCGASVTLDGSGSSDKEGNELTYSWYYGDKLFAEGVEVEVDLGLGKHKFTLIVNNGVNDSLPDRVVITVADKTPPQVTLTMEPALIWSPDNKMVKVTPIFKAIDNCSEESTIELVDITCNQKSNGDIEVNDEGIFLRARRDAKDKEGRIYTITYKITDKAGNETITAAEVKVPHGRGRRKIRNRRLSRPGLRR